VAGGDYEVALAYHGEADCGAGEGEDGAAHKDLVKGAGEDNRGVVAERRRRRPMRPMFVPTRTRQFE
jgi:hypothetical protein